jgi:predicted nucleotidyltransferase
VITWPDAAEVDRAVRRWAADAARRHPEVLRIGYFGSYARGDWGVGSDLDLVAVVTDSEERPDRRALAWDLGALPVAADLLIYTREEWRRMVAEGGRFIRTLEREAVWVVGVDV